MADTKKCAHPSQVLGDGRRTVRRYCSERLQGAADQTELMCDCNTRAAGRRLSDCTAAGGGHTWETSMTRRTR
jgi:hypothetical protein